MTTPSVAVPAGQLAPWAAQSRRHPPWGPSWQLPVGQRPPAGSGEPGAAVEPGPLVVDLATGRWTIDLDSTMCETYGLAKEGARHHGYGPASGAITRSAIAAGTWRRAMSRLREGRANTVRGAAHFLRETVGRVRQLGLGDNSRCGPTAASMPTPWSSSAARWMSASPSPSANTPASGS